LRIVLDADVLIGALDASDPHHVQARTLFRRWRAEASDILISVVNLSEVLVAPAAEPGRLARAREAVAALGVDVHRPTEAVGVRAARLRHGYPISLADAYCLATARYADAALATFDQKVVDVAGTEQLTIAVGSRTRRRRRG